MSLRLSHQVLLESTLHPPPFLTLAMSNRRTLRSPPCDPELDDHERTSGMSPTAEPRRWRDTAISWWQNTMNPAPANPAPVQSGYLTLIPLSDDRLKPRRTKLTVAVLLSLAMLLAGMVFILVPRELTTGEIRIFSDQMSWNSTKGTYQLDLLAHVPIYNPNYLAVRCAHIPDQTLVLSNSMPVTKMPAAVRGSRSSSVS